MVDVPRVSDKKVQRDSGQRKKKQHCIFHKTTSQLLNEKEYEMIPDSFELHTKIGTTKQHLTRHAEGNTTPDKVQVMSTLKKDRTVVVMNGRPPFPEKPRAPWQDNGTLKWNRGKTKGMLASRRFFSDEDLRMVTDHQDGDATAEKQTDNKNSRSVS
eukprot:TRINITY_DN22731_c0_g1_i1.p1 TRINITY_DN22731_c0_g1~~TRINITY_DN22731_c0_g1_i1.p1  ORF type:complete len:157 (-),score=25.05 TRINITY_DN22731_c0_g1_i1:255-725(-)